MSFVLALLAGSAAACTSPVDPGLAFWPESDAIDVPVDVVPEVWLPYDVSDTAVQLRDSSGAGIDVVLEDGTRDHSQRLVPTHELLSDTVYTLELLTDDEVYRSSTFTTGRGRVDAIEGPPEITLVGSRAEPRGMTASCEPEVFWEVELDIAEPSPAPRGGRRYHVYEVTADGATVRWVDGGTAAWVSTLWIDVDDLSAETCIALVAEDALGTPSPPSAPLCFSDGADPLDTGATEAGDSGGCSVTPGAPLGGALLGLLALATRRRR